LAIVVIVVNPNRERWRQFQDLLEDRNSCTLKDELPLARRADRPAALVLVLRLEFLAALTDRMDRHRSNRAPWIRNQTSMVAFTVRLNKGMRTDE
jgi:hypothetical protein